MIRSLRPEVRNPVLALPEAQLLLSLHPDVRRVLAQLFIAIAKTGRDKAQLSWRKNKGPMALYWKVVGVYAYHIARVLRSA